MKMPIEKINTVRDLGSILRSATMRGSRSLVNLIIKARADINAIDDHSGSTALHLAVLMGNIPVIDMLIKAQADMLVVDKQFRIPLECCVCKSAEVSVAIFKCFPAKHIKKLAQDKPEVKKRLDECIKLEQSSKISSLDLKSAVAQYEEIRTLLANKTPYEYPQLVKEITKQILDMVLSESSYINGEFSILFASVKEALRILNKALMIFSNYIKEDNDTNNHSVAQVNGIRDADKAIKTLLQSNLLDTIQQGVTKELAETFYQLQEDRGAELAIEQLHSLFHLTTLERSDKPLFLILEEDILLDKVKPLFSTYISLMSIFFKDIRTLIDSYISSNLDKSLKTLADKPQIDKSQILLNKMKKMIPHGNFSSSSLPEGTENNLEDDVPSAKRAKIPLSTEIINRAINNDSSAQQEVLRLNQAIRNKNYNEIEHLLKTCKLDSLTTADDFGRIPIFAALVVKDRTSLELIKRYIYEHIHDQDYSIKPSLGGNNLAAITNLLKTPTASWLTPSVTIEHYIRPLYDDSSVNDLVSLLGDEYYRDYYQYSYHFL